MEPPDTKDYLWARQARAKTRMVESVTLLPPFNRQRPRCRGASPKREISTDFVKEAGFERFWPCSVWWDSAYGNPLPSRGNCRILLHLRCTTPDLGPVLSI